MSTPMMALAQSAQWLPAAQLTGDVVRTLAGHEARDGGLARARRAPEENGSGVAALDGHAQRLTGPEEMGLPRHFDQ